MSKYVSESKAARSVRAIAIFKGSELRAQVTAHFGSGGGVLVNAFQHGKALERSAKARKLAFVTSDDKSKASDKLGFQHKKCAGYGYDKFTAALSGMIIDGHEMTDHCGGRQKLPKGAKVFPEGFKPRKGYRLANYKYREWVEGSRDMVELPESERGYTDCYRDSGLAYLSALGYTIVEVL